MISSRTMVSMTGPPHHSRIALKIYKEKYSIGEASAPPGTLRQRSWRGFETPE
jgi:hypothetical protein